MDILHQWSCRIVVSCFKNLTPVVLLAVDGIQCVRNQQACSVLEAIFDFLWWVQC